MWLKLNKAETDHSSSTTKQIQSQFLNAFMIIINIKENKDIEDITHLTQWISAS
jgi:hypothetical protein